MRAAALTGTTAADLARRSEPWRRNGSYRRSSTALPLLVAFWLARRPANDRFTYGYGRAEDLAGLFVVAMIALSSLLAGWEAIDRLLHPQAVSYLGAVAAAGVIGFAGNEIVARYRIRVGHQIGSAALVADGLHASRGPTPSSGC